MTATRTESGSDRPAELPRELVFALDDEPGIERHGRRRFRYVDQLTGRTIGDREVLARISALAVPPAWTDVWISADPRGHLQATGRDARGRKQYRYHARYRAHQEEAKFDQLGAFGQSLPTIRRQVSQDLRRSGLPEEKVVALVVWLLERTLVRVGNEEYVRANGSYGLTTLRDRHARFEGSRLRIRFTAKSAKVHDVEVHDPRMARLVRQCQELPGQVLFQYLGEDDSPHPVRSSDVNDYLHELTRERWTAKTFRTWAATLRAVIGLASLPAPGSAQEGRRLVSGVITAVSGSLHNTPAVCRRSYIHPGIVEQYLAGKLGEEWEDASARGSPWLSPEERRLLHVLPQLPTGTQAPGNVYVCTEPPSA